MTRFMVITILLISLAACTGPQGTTPAPTAPATAAERTPTRRAPTAPPAATPPPAPSASAQPPAGTPEPPAERGTVVIFPAADGVRLHGAFYTPAGEPPLKTLILVHGSGTDRHAWDTFVPVLQGAGYAVLTYDTRGAGLSDPVAPDSATPDSLLYDVTGALNWLATRPDVDGQHVGVIGASLGANVAYAANGATTRLRAAVLLSPIDTGGALLGTDVPGFVSRSVLFVSDEAGVPLAQALFDQTRAPRQLYTAPPEVRAQGTALLAMPEVVTEILNWLTEQL